MNDTPLVSTTPRQPQGRQPIARQLHRRAAAKRAEAPKELDEHGDRQSVYAWSSGQPHPIHRGYPAVPMPHDPPITELLQGLARGEETDGEQLGAAVLDRLRAIAHKRDGSAQPGTGGGDDY